MANWTPSHGITLFHSFRHFFFKALQCDLAIFKNRSVLNLCIIMYLI